MINKTKGTTQMKLNLDNLTKFDIKNPNHRKLYELFMDFSPYTQTFITNPIWMTEGKYYLATLDHETILFLKKSQMYGKDIIYAITKPTILTNDPNRQNQETLIYKALQEQLDFQLTDLDLEYLSISPEAKKETLYTEFTYKLTDYNNLEGKDYLKWRKVMNKVDQEYKPKFFDLNKSTPFTLQTHLMQILDSWKQDRSKYVANFTDWYIKNLRHITNGLVILIYTNEGKPYSYSISQRVDNQIYFLDEKSDRDQTPLRNQARFHHIKTLEFFAEQTNKQDLIMTSGIGDKEYTHNEHTYNLNEHKRSLRPHRELKIYKIRHKND